MFIFLEIFICNSKFSEHFDSPFLETSVFQLLVEMDLVSCTIVISVISFPVDTHIKIDVILIQTICIYIYIYVCVCVVGRKEQP